MNDTLAHSLKSALGSLAGGCSLRDGAAEFLGVLGYSSKRTINLGGVDEFLNRFVTDNDPTERQRRLFDPWTAVELVCQFTAGEIPRQYGLPATAGFDQGREKSFLFLAVDLEDSADTSTRTYLADTTRAVNHLFAMPAIILFRRDSTLTLAAIHRRAHKRDDTRNVLKKVMLVKDICIDNPHRAHIEILSELAFGRLTAAGVRNFDALHEQWERTLDIESLNRRFYRELFGWFERAVAQCRLPDDGAGAGFKERHVIRLITRLLFIWFLKEKDLVPAELFEESFARAMLRNHVPGRTDYYRAVLQNLFFATLNTEIGKRRFRDQDNPAQPGFNEFRYPDLLTDPEAFAKSLEQVPFVNGGLFDCLDGFTDSKPVGGLVDAFTDDPKHDSDLCVPAELFFDDKGLFTILHGYKFTVEENTPLDQEVALDPELLGRVFENLLAAYNPETRATARKATGSYYTPRPVVDYMVRQALTEALASVATPEDGDIASWRERLEYLLDHSNAIEDADKRFEGTERRKIVAGIAEMRTLDPAVGSGAFPMGILQTLTLALRRIDPDNNLWEEVQKDRARAQAGKVFDIPEQKARDEALREISDTFERYRHSNFGRKLYLIQNGIYGVDIQPIACQIAKLRFFISLVIEQKADPNSENLGIKPLPNLETRLVAADSLLPLKARTKDLLHEDTLVSKQREVAAVRERYFLANSRERKLECMREEKRLRAELHQLLETECRKWTEAQRRSVADRVARIPNAEAREKVHKDELLGLSRRRREFDETLSATSMIAQWDPYNQNTRADWFSAKYMFGVDEGFDVVIGNPPYIQLQKDQGRAAKVYGSAGYQTFQRTGDIYQLFFERGCGLLRPQTGVLAYITSNSWLKAEYGKSLRRWFSEHHSPLQLVEMGKDVFENAIVDTAVFVVRAGNDNPVICRAVDAEQKSGNQFPPSKRKWGTLKPDGERPWMALSKIERDVMRKMEAVGTPLKEWDIRIYRGILTGLNDAFIVDQATRDALVAADPRSAEILKPVLRGRDIARYRANWAGLWLISTLPALGLEIDDYPAIKRHLLSFGRDRLAQEGRVLLGEEDRGKRHPTHGMNYRIPALTMAVSHWKK